MTCTICRRNKDDLSRRCFYALKPVKISRNNVLRFIKNEGVTKMPVNYLLRRQNGVLYPFRVGDGIYDLFLMFFDSEFLSFNFILLQLDLLVLLQKFAIGIFQIYCFFFYEAVELVDKKVFRFQ